jgi:hypothetical protein
VAKDLKVQALVTGRIVQHGDQLIISSELIDARTNRNLWGDQYDRKVADALSVQQEITGAISAKLRERLSGETQKQVAKGGTSDPEAYQLYLKGLYYWEKRTPETLDKAKDYFSQAIERDPAYAMAYVGLANYYVAAPDYGPIPENVAAPKAKAAAEKALAIDPSSAEAHAALGALCGACLISPLPKPNSSGPSKSIRISPTPTTGMGSSCPGRRVTLKLWLICVAPSNWIP